MTSPPHQKSFSIIVATDQNNGIGLKNTLPWPRLADDMKFFRSVSSGTRDLKMRNAVIMGRNTWESIPASHRPLVNRLNIVLTRAETMPLNDSNDVKVMRSLDEALEFCFANDSLEQTFVIGGAEVYAEALKHPRCARVYRTAIRGTFECDKFFPEISSQLYAKYVQFDQRRVYKTSPQDGSEPIEYTFECYDRREHDEYQYLDMVQDILESGNVKGDRTGTGVISKFGRQMRFSLRDGQFPLLTTKRVFWKGVAQELLWFVNGDTSAKKLSDQGVHIWDDNGTREFLDKRGLTDREEGDLGPVYGFQWRHWGAEYTNMHADYRGKGIDQLQECIDTIKNNPTDRRIIMTAWNPSDLDKMALPPCHMMCQFYVANGELSCQMYQRSCDLGLGVPFNIASYALLTCMMAKVCGLQPGEFVHVLGDAHVYSNHVEALKVQLQREPRPFPILKINSDAKTIDGFKYEDFEIIGYKPHGTIKMKMAV